MKTSKFMALPLNPENMADLTIFPEQGKTWSGSQSTATVLRH